MPDASQPSLDEIVAERDRMLDAAVRYRRGEVTSAALPTDAHTFPGQTMDANRLIAVRQEEQREYDRQMVAAKAYGYRATKESLVAISGAEYGHLELLRSTAESWRRGVENTGEALVDQEFVRYPALSQDDWLDAYRRGANKAIQEWYFEQKRELGLSVRNAQQQDHTTARSEAQKPVLETHPDRSAIGATDGAKVIRELVTIMNDEAGRIDREWHNAKVQSAEQATAAINHYRGQATAFNRLREEVLQRHPEAKKDLPQRIDLEQIRVQRNLVIEQELVERRQAVSTR